MLYKEYGSSKKYGFIDMVFIVIEWSNRDMGTTYKLLNDIIVPNFQKDRVLVAINQADVAMKGRYWDYENNKPEPKLIEFLKEKAQSVKNRVKEATGVEVEPIYYSAGYKDGDEEQRPWNLSKLLYFVVKNTPTEKRLSYVNNLSQNKEMWQDDDDLMNYREETRKSFIETIKDTAVAGGDIGREIGEIFGMGKTGEVIGKVVGTAAGTIKAAWNVLTSWW